MKRILMSVMALAMLTLAACSEAKATPYRIAYVVSNGADDNRTVKEIVMPGHSVNKESDDDVEFIYANSRNFNVANRQGADIQGWWESLSKPSDDGATPGYKLTGEGIMPFAVNRIQGDGNCRPESMDPACRVLFTFFQYCEKYGCQTSEDIDSDNPEEQSLSSDPGWMNMLREGLGNALQHAFVATAAEYDANIANDPSKWAEFGKKMGERVWVEMRTIIGATDDLNIFCNPTIISGGKCEAPVVQMHTLKCPDCEALLAQRRDLATNTKNEKDKIATDTELENARHSLEQLKAQHFGELYGQPGYAQERQIQANIELLAKCKEAGQTCIVTIGSGGVPQIQVQTQAGAKQ